MKIFFTRKKNREHNLGVRLADSMINGQGLGEVAKLRYGICPMSFNGCEVIAVHNALRYAGKPHKLQDIAFFLEKYRVLLGLFGCNVFRLGRALEKFGVDHERVDRIDELPAFIISFWTGRPLLSEIHTVFCVREKDEIMVYNRYNSCGTVRRGTAENGLFGRYKPIVVYAVSAQPISRARS